MTPNYLLVSVIAVFPLFAQAPVVVGRRRRDPPARSPGTAREQRRHVEVCGVTRRGSGNYGIGEDAFFVHDDRKESIRLAGNFRVRMLNANLNKTGNIFQVANTSQRIILMGANQTRRSSAGHQEGGAQCSR